MNQRTETMSLRDGYSCQVRVFTPSDGIEHRRPVVYLHGIQSHGGWFVESAARLASAGHVVLLPDRRGSGLNDRDRGHARSVRQLIDDGRAYLDAAADLAGQPGQPVHLLGVSWGGKWAVALAAELADRVASLTLSTPGLYAQRTLRPLARLAVAFCAGLAPRTRFTIPLSEPELFTDVPRWRQFIADDPLRLRTATARFMLLSHLMERRLNAWASAMKCPTLLLLADRDPIIDNQRVLSLLTRSPVAAQLTVKRFAAAVHTLEFTAEPEDYFGTLTDWLRQ